MKRQFGARGSIFFFVSTVGAQATDVDYYVGFSTAPHPETVFSVSSISYVSSENDYDRFLNPLKP